MDRASALKRFKEMGLTLYEARSYLSLLEKDTLTVSEVSKLAEIPRTNAYEALEKLMSKGLCISKPGQIKKYSASEPSILRDKFLYEANQVMETELANLIKKEKEILEKLKTEKEAQLANLSEKEKEILGKNTVVRENLTDLIEELTPVYENSRSKSNPLEYIEIIKDPYQIHKRYMQLIGAAKEEILSCTKPPFTVPREKRQEQIDQFNDTMKRGVRQRCIYEILTDENEKKWQLEMIKGAIKDGVEARVIEELPMKITIFDSRIVIFALEDPVTKQPSLTSQIVEHHALAKSLKILFETLWNQAKDYRFLTG